MRKHELAFLLLSLACCNVRAKCPAEIAGASRARLEAAAASVADAPLAPDSLRFCEVFKVGTAHIATVSIPHDDGSETWTGVTCFGQHSGHGKWSCSAQPLRGISVIVAPGSRDERITIAEGVDPRWARAVIQQRCRSSPARATIRIAPRAGNRRSHRSSLSGVG